MPYIKKDRREDFENALKYIKDVKINEAGEFNYLVSMLCKIYATSKNFNYQVINDIVGALEGAKFEYIRRNVNDYENKKIEENGDI